MEGIDFSLPQLQSRSTVIVNGWLRRSQKTGAAA